MTKLITLLFILSLSFLSNAQTKLWNLPAPTIISYKPRVLNLEVIIPSHIASKGGLANCYLYKDTTKTNVVLAGSNYKILANSTEERYTFEIKDVEKECYFLQYAILANDNTYNFSPYKEICLDQISGISNAEETLIKFYPNPVSSELSIDVPDASLTQVRIFDLQGQLVTTNHLNVGLNRFDISYLSNGIYLLHFNNGTTAKLEVSK